MKKTRFTIEIISYLLIVLFVYAGVNKILDYQKFTVQIGQSPLLAGFGNWIPWMVIALEFLIALLIIIPRLRLYGFFASFSIMTMFTAYIAAILTFSTQIPCSCGGILEKLGWTEHLIFNSGFILLSLIAIILQWKLEKRMHQVTTIHANPTLA